MNPPVPLIGLPCPCREEGSVQRERGKVVP
jgi:hypothetical protein